MERERRKQYHIPPAVAVDFDGTICKSAWPEIGEPNWDLIKWLVWWRENGGKLILWTNRCGELLAEAVEACRLWGIEFDAVNENLPERIELYGNDSRKISADYYIDDKSAYLNEIGPMPIVIYH